MANIALRAAREASTYIARSFDRPDLLKVSAKSHNDFVTNIDKECEIMIVNALRATYPEHQIIGEESANNNVRADAEYSWIIDPIDGTFNFVRQLPHFCVSIACLHKGKLEHGIIVDPIRNEEFVTSRGKGCQLNGQRVRVSPKQDLDGALIGMGGATINSEKQSQLYAKLRAERSNIREQGSSCLDLAYVACGRLDGLWMYNLKPWDMAAGALMIIESGGLIGDFNGGAEFMKNGNVIAGNPKCFKALTSIIKRQYR